MVSSLYTFIGVVIALGLGIGFFFQNRLKKSHQDRKIPSAFQG